MPRHTTALLVATLILPATALLAQEKPNNNETKATEPVLVLEKFVTDGNVADPLGVLPTGPSESAFGFRVSPGQS